MGELDTVTDFLIELGMKPCMHLIEISIFALNDVTARLTKIMNNLLEHLKILTSKSFFSVENWLNLSKKNFFEEYWTRRPTFLISLVLYFLKMCPILSTLLIILIGLMVTLFSEKMLIYTRCICHSLFVNFCQFVKRLACL